MTGQVITFTMPNNPEIKIKVEPTARGIIVCGPDGKKRILGKSA